MVVRRVEQHRFIRIGAIRPHRLTNRGTLDTLASPGSGGYASFDFTRRQHRKTLRNEGQIARSAPTADTEGMTE